jgi:hypothetical protein
VSWGHVCENDRPHCRFPPYWYWCWMPKESKGYILTELLFLSSAGFSFFLSWFKFFIEHVIVSILISPSTTSLFVVSLRFFYLLKEKQIHVHWFKKKKQLLIHGSLMHLCPLLQEMVIASTEHVSHKVSHLTVQDSICG